MSTGVPLASGEIEVGHHITVEVFGLTFNADTIWTTFLAGAIVVGLGLLVRRNATSGVPSKLQLIWEGIVRTVNTNVEQNLGRVHPFVVPLAIGLFTFILVANLFEVIPSGEAHLLPPPTADVNLTYALAFFVIGSMHVYSVRRRGVKKYFKAYFEPYPALFPLKVIEEIVKPFTLALRLFGNIFAGGIMLSLIGLMPLYILWGPEIIWKAFGIFIGLIQAFIFALLTILYFAEAGEVHEDDEHTDANSSSAAASDRSEADGPTTDRDTEEPASDRPLPAGASAR
ncbi:MAG: synthase subcomplex subunit [Nocardioidaceae bacterium]|jgi:F-type H+-transporting ATPase subunit a|nr:synthase subcomplex subunit [Nocardioidaceae bacterium]